LNVRRMEWVSRQNDQCHRGVTGLGGVGNKKVTSKRINQYQYEAGSRGMYFLPTTSGVSYVASYRPEPITGRQLQIVLNTCSSSCRPLQVEVKFVLQFIYDLWLAVCVFILFIYLAFQRSIRVDIELVIVDLFIYRVDIRLVVWRKFHFCCRTAGSCYMCDVNYSVFALLRILSYIYACLVCFIQLRKRQRRVGVVYDSVTVFFISSWKLKSLAYLLNVHNVSL
jgi:hypothetical protein